MIACFVCGGEWLDDITETDTGSYTRVGGVAPVWSGPLHDEAHAPILLFEPGVGGQDESLRSAFEDLRDEWKRDTEVESLISRVVVHRAYQQIIGMGPSVLPFVLEELRREPDYWFWALTALTGEDPAEGCDTLDEATSAWIEWGLARGYLRD